MEFGYNHQDPKDVKNHPKERDRRRVSLWPSLLVFVLSILIIILLLITTSAVDSQSGRPTNTPWPPTHTPRPALATLQKIAETMVQEQYGEDIAAATAIMLEISDPIGAECRRKYIGQLNSGVLHLFDRCYAVLNEVADFFRAEATATADQNAREHRATAHYANLTQTADAYDRHREGQLSICSLGQQQAGICTIPPTRTPFAGCQHSIDPRIGSDCGAWDHRSTAVPPVIIVGPVQIAPDAEATIFQGARDHAGQNNRRSSGTATPSAEELNRRIHQGSRQGRDVDKEKNEYRRRYGNPCRWVNGRVVCVH